MKKKLALVSFCFLALGYYLLVTIPKAHNNINNYNYTWDLEEYCDQDSYLLTHQSLFEREILEETLNKYIPILQNQSLHEIFKPHGVSNQEIAALSKALSSYVRARDIAVGDFYDFKLSNQLIEIFIIKKPDPNRLPITYKAVRKSLKSEDVNFLVTTSSPGIIKKLELVTINIKDTLFESFASIPFGNELLQRVLSILTWRMRLPEQVAKNDNIKILVTKNYAEDKFIGYGHVQALIYSQAHQNIYAFYFVSKDNKIAGYYDERGFSLEKEFLVSPVVDTVATSNQQLRFHPVYKTRMRHNGTDFRGSIGTDFFSIADGEIIEKRFDKHVGYMIRIRHKYGIHSEYFHADSLVENLHVGSVVKRGQIIGKIGRTGILCTGPHLHLGLYKLDREKRKYLELSSLRKRLLDLGPLSNNYLAEFSKITQQALAQASFTNKFKKSGEISRN